MYFVYIIQNEDGLLYKGYTTDYRKRLEQHNNDESRYTKGKGPWVLFYVEQCTDKTAALKREKQLKRANGKYLKWLFDQPTNLLNQ